MRAFPFSDADEWSTFSKIGDPVLHIDLRRWAHAMLIVARCVIRIVGSLLAYVPSCSANTLCKLAYGLSDNLLTCTARAWDSSRPIVIGAVVWRVRRRVVLPRPYVGLHAAPAMNTLMWNNPLTHEHLERFNVWLHVDSRAVQCHASLVCCAAVVIADSP